MVRIFISYRTTDETFAAATLEDRLAAHFGPGSVFRDSTSLPADRDFRPVLSRSLAHADALVVVIGPHWLDRDATGRRSVDDPGDFVRQEIELGLDAGIPIVVPVLVNGAAELTAGDLPEPIRALAARRHVRLHGRSDRYDVQPLIDELSRQLATADRPSVQKVPARPGTPAPYTAILVGIEDGSEPADDLVRGSVAMMAAGALTDLDVPAVDVVVRPLGDDLLFLAPSIVAPVVGAGLARALHNRLVGSDADAGPRPRLRVAMDHGFATDDGRHAHGPVVETLREMVDSPALRAVLDAAPTVRVVLVITEEFFGLAVRGRRRVDASAYLQTDLGGGRTGWVHVPDRPAPPGLRPHRRNRANRGRRGRRDGPPALSEPQT